MISRLLTTLLLAASAAASAAPEPMSDKERIDALIRQNLSLSEENARLAALASRPPTKEEAFVQCMQAVKSQSSAMAVESIGMRCDRLLKLEAR